MGQKIHPKLIRIGISKDWSSKWFATRDYPLFLKEDYNIRQMLLKKYKTGGIADVEISRSKTDAKITIRTSKPGVLIGRAGAGIEQLKKDVQKLTVKKAGVSIEEVDMPENHAAIVGRNIADQIEKRIPYRRAVKMTLEQTMKAGVRGIRIKVGGRLNGADIARTETFSLGKIPLSSLREDIDFAHTPAHTTYGIIGVKVWIFRKEVKK
ncbi:MAG: 30S ribosomal protein S3 [Patescibacteria group bacterium]